MKEKKGIPLVGKLKYESELKKEIRKEIFNAVKNLPGTEDFNEDFIQLEHPIDSSHGEWSSNVVMRLRGVLGKNPIDIKKDLQLYLNQDKKGSYRFSFAKEVPFINVQLNALHEGYLNEVSTIIKEADVYGEGDDLKDKRIMVEYAHPNVFKAFHIGHLRNIILGESIVRMLEARGAEVIRTNYQGDVGMHIAKCLWAFRDFPEGQYPKTPTEKSNLLGNLYAKGSAAFEEDEKVKEEIKAINKLIYSKKDADINKLWQRGKDWSLEKFAEIFDRVYSTFDRQYMESEIADDGVRFVQEAVEKGILKKDDGAIIFDGSDYHLDTRVFLNSEGLPTYEGKELGLAYKEFTDFGRIDLCIHNVAVEQISFFKVTFKVEELLDPKLFKDKQYHNAYEFVGLKSGKMSSRKGNVVLADDVLDEAKLRIQKVVEEKGMAKNIDEASELIAIGAVKFSFLKVSAYTYVAFDFDESLSFEGFSAPYLQYTFARTQSILRENKAEIKSPIVSRNDLEPLEEQLLKWLVRYKEVVTKATSELTPHYICEYLFELAQKYNSFYKHLSVLNADSKEIKDFRLQITQATGQILKNGLNLLGIKVLKRM